MSNDLLNIGLSFIEGFALIISPCILPILPIILAGSLEGNKKKPFGIIIGFVLTFALFTFFSRKLVEYSGIDLSIVRYFSLGLLFLFGLILLSSFLSEQFMLRTQRLMNVGSHFSNNPRGGFFSGVIFGGLIGVIWTPCAGPILAAVIVLTVLQKETFNSFLIVLAFGMGAAIPMFLIALFGRLIAEKLNFFKERAILFRKILGVIIILSVLYMLFGENFTLPFARPENPKQVNNNMLRDGLMNPYPAPPLEDIHAWINSQPITLQELKGKVVLIDFWTYSCINCIRTLPFLKEWYQKYHTLGFEIIGVHSPEFVFEKNLENVKKAVKENGIFYPVALDNNFITWQNYQNHYWPAHYLIDKKGNVVYEHFGEGKYEETENNIRFLLGLNEPITLPHPNPITFRALTPETYLGYSRSENYASPESIQSDQVGSYHFPKELAENKWALQGQWKVTAEKITSVSENAAIRIHFSARKVFVVMGNTGPKPIEVKVFLNGKKVSSFFAEDHKLYTALSLPEVSDGIMQLEAVSPGLEFYTFTFG